MAADDPTGPSATGPSDPEALSPAARENIDVLAEYQEQESAEVSRTQAAIESLSTLFGSPAYLMGAVAFIAIWVALNLVGSRAGWQHVDEPPFFWLQGIVSSNALLLTVAVLIRQNRMGVLAARRAHLDLHVNLLTERKVSKVLALVQELQRQLTPGEQNDTEARDLAKASNPQAILEAIKQSETDRPEGRSHKAD